MRGPRKAKWTALAAVTAIAVAAATMGVTFGAFAGQTGVSGNVITAVPDFRGPAVARVAIGKTAGNGLHALRPGVTYFVYAQVADVGTPPSGVSGVTANVSTVTAGQTAVPLLPGSFNAGGQTWNYRGAVLTAGALPNGPLGYTVTATDAATNVTNMGGTVNIDSTAPAPSGISATGGTAGRLEVGDTLTLTTNDTLDSLTILANWTGGATTVQVRLVNNAGGDRLEIRNSTGATVLPFGTINLGRTDFVGGGGAQFSAATMTQSGNTIAVVLGGTVTGTPGTAGGTGTMVWTPSATVTDRAGNAMSTAAFNEPAPLDTDF